MKFAKQSIVLIAICVDCELLSCAQLTVAHITSKASQVINKWAGSSYLFQRRANKTRKEEEKKEKTIESSEFERKKWKRRLLVCRNLKLQVQKESINMREHVFKSFNQTKPKEGEEEERKRSSS